MVSPGLFTLLLDPVGDLGIEDPDRSHPVMAEESRRVLSKVMEHLDEVSTFKYLYSELTKLVGAEKVTTYLFQSEFERVVSHQVENVGDSVHVELYATLDSKFVRNN